MKKLFALLLIAIFTPLLVSCKEEDKYELYRVPIYTEVFTVLPQVIIVDTSQKIKALKGNQDFINGIKEIFLRLDITFDVIDNTDSLISRINQNAGITPVEVTDEVINIIKTSIAVSESTKINGQALYDISIFPVWDIWDFEDKYKEEGDIPTQEEINTYLPLVDYQKIIIDEDNKTVFLADVGMKIDLGSIVKGYACDKIKEYLLLKGYPNALIDVGGNIMTMGKYKGKEWSIKIATPFYFEFPSNTNINPKHPEQYYVGQFYDNDITVVTSGIYERYFINQGIRYHHILNPKTGYPINNGLMSVTIVTNNSMQADAYSTSVFCMGLEAGAEFVEELEDVEAIFITENKEVYITSGLKDKFVFNTALEDVLYTYKGVKNGTNNS